MDFAALASLQNQDLERRLRQQQQDRGLMVGQQIAQGFQQNVSNQIAQAEENRRAFSHQTMKIETAVAGHIRKAKEAKDKATRDFHMREAKAAAQQAKVMKKGLSAAEQETAVVGKEAEQADKALARATAEKKAQAAAEGARQGNINAAKVQKALDNIEGVSPEDLEGMDSTQVQDSGNIERREHVGRFVTEQEVIDSQPQEIVPAVPPRRTPIDSRLDGYIGGWGRKIRGEPPGAPPLAPSLSDNKMYKTAPDGRRYEETPGRPAEILPGKPIRMNELGPEPEIMIPGSRLDQITHGGDKPIRVQPAAPAGEHQPASESTESKLPPGTAEVIEQAVQSLPEVEDMAPEEQQQVASEVSMKIKQRIKAKPIRVSNPVEIGYTREGEAVERPALAQYPEIQKFTVEQIMDAMGDNPDTQKMLSKGGRGYVEGLVAKLLDADELAQIQRHSDEFAMRTRMDKEMRAKEAHTMNMNRAALEMKLAQSSDDLGWASLMSQYDMAEMEFKKKLLSKDAPKMGDFDKKAFNELLDKGKRLDTELSSIAKTTSESYADMMLLAQHVAEGKSPKSHPVYKAMNAAARRQLVNMMNEPMYRAAALAKKHSSISELGEVAWEYKQQQRVLGRNVSMTQAIMEMSKSMRARANQGRPTSKYAPVGSKARRKLIRKAHEKYAPMLREKAEVPKETNSMLSKSLSKMDAGKRAALMKRIWSDATVDYAHLVERKDGVVVGPNAAGLEALKNDKQLRNWLAWRTAYYLEAGGYD